MTRSSARAHAFTGAHPAVPATDRQSLRQCRDLLPPGLEVSDQELERVRNELYALAEALLGASGHLL